MAESEILEFVEQMRPRDHVILFYSKPEDKRLVLFTYLKAGLDQGEAAAYVAGEELPNQIRSAMERFGIDVDGCEKTGSLRIIDYKDWYMIGGEFNASRTMELWRNLYDEVTAKGFKSLRVAGEMACFFENGKVQELVEYEKALHRVLELPMAAICAYETDVVAQEGRGELYLDLIKAHSTVVFTGLGAGIVAVEPDDANESIARHVAS